jgi:hypothetical protein
MAGGPAASPPGMRESFLPGELPDAPVATLAEQQLPRAPRAQGHWAPLSSCPGYHSCAPC